MRKVLVILFALLLVVPLVAQQRTGRITGKVVDEDGNPIPGVTVTLLATAGAPMRAISTAEGNFRFMSLPPSTGYALKAELEGFKTKTETNIIVAVGQTTDIVLAMEMGALEEEVTVVAVSPVVDVKRTSISTTLNYETLQSLPSARDPWVILQMTPSVQVDRENVGGNESGQQASYVALGASGSQDTWTMDGVNITDPAAMGASPTYYDYDVFEEVNVTIGGADVEQQTGGVALNLVSRRGENRITFGGRFYYTESRFQATPSGDTYEEIEARFPGFGYNQIRDIKDFGFNLGGPLFKDRIWWWVSYGVQEIKTTVINGSNDDTFLNNYAGKVNIQIIPENRLELFIHAGDKKKFGRGSGSDYPAGRNQGGKYHFGSPILKIQDEHMFGDSFFLSAKYGFTDAGFGLWPADDMELNKMRIYDIEQSLHYYYSWFMTERPNTHITAHGTYFNDDLVGASHEIKIGVEFARRKQGSVSGSAGNMRSYFNYHTETVDWDGDGTQDIVRDDFGIDLNRLYFYRGNAGNGPRQVDHWAAFLSDTATWGRLTLKLGLRWDRQVSSDPNGYTVKTIFQEDSTEQYYENYYEIQQRRLEPGVGDAIFGIFPGMSTPPVDASVTTPWQQWSPRIGLTYDITGDGKTILKLSGASYGSRMYSGTAYLWRRGGTGGGLNFWWADHNGNGAAGFNELYWSDYSSATRTAYRAFTDGGAFVGNWDREEGLHWSGYDPNDPGATTDPRYIIDPDFNGDTKTLEALASLEREILPDFMVGVDVAWRKYWGLWSNRSFSEFTDENNFKLLQRDDYVAAADPVPNTLPDGTGTGDVGGRPWYVLRAGVPYIWNLYATNLPDDYYQTYLGASIRFTKRLSNRWMLNGSFGWQTQKNHWGATYPANPSDQWARDGQTYAYTLGGASGKEGMPVFSRWMVKAQGLYQLPYDWNVSFTFNAREGHILPQELTVYSTNVPNSRDRSETVDRYIWGSERLPTFWNVNLRIEKVLRVGDTGRIFLMADIFNVFNQNILNRQLTDNPGTLYLHRDPVSLSANARSAEPNEVLNPRVFRFGVRFQF